MALLSNTFTLRISAAPSSAVRAAAALISPGSWGTVTVTNQLNCDPNGSGDGMHSYSPQMTVDLLNERMHFWGGVHGAAFEPSGIQRMHHGVYIASSNSWTTVSTPSQPATTGGVHSYYGGTVDMQTGDFYGCMTFNSPHVTYKRTFSTQAWSNPFPNVPDDASSATSASLIYHPGLYGGQGGLVHTSQRGIWTLNLRAGSPSWTRIVSTFPAMGQFHCAVYDYKLSAVIAGGADEDGGNVYRINAHAGAGSATTIPHPAMGLNSSSGTRILVPAGNPANNLCVLDRSGNAEQFNGTSWSSFSSGHPSASYTSGDAPGWSSAGAWPDPVTPANGFIVISRGVRTGGLPRTSLTMDIWKR